MPSTKGGAGLIVCPAKLARRSFIGCGGPWREWWAVLGTVTEELEGFGLVAFELKEDGGKCLFLYF